MVKNSPKGYTFKSNNYHRPAKWGLYMPEIYYEKDTQFMVNQLVNEFYNRFLFKIDALP